VIISLEAAAIGSGIAADVPALTLTLASGAPTVIAAETDERPKLVSMLVGGRTRPTSGRVLIDGRVDDARLRSATALVDTPFVSEPPAAVSLAVVVAEELSFSNRHTSRGAVTALLAEHGLGDYAAAPVGVLPAVDRIRLFTELALLREGVRCIILTSPERHGADPAEWYPILEAIADRDILVVVVTDALTRNYLISVGAQDASLPLQPLESRQS
jgi:ABC-2 type transport system ATP-binding protein